MAPLSSKTKKSRRRQDDERPQTSPEAPASDLPSSILTLQRSAGNQAVSGLLQRKPAAATLPVSEPGDTSERQADRVADEVMGSQATAGSLQEGGSVSSKASGAATGSVHDLGSGEPLDPAMRASFEPDFGADFSGVRVHSDEKAARSARDLNARAFTVGSDVVFAEGEYQPHTSAGKHLLAHELAHVVQQGAGPAMVQRAVALKDDDYKALAAQIHDAIFPVGTDEEAIFSALQKLEKDPTAITKLSDVYKKEFSSALEVDIRGDLSEVELQLALELLGIKDDPKAADLVATVPSTDDEYKAIAKRLHAAMNPLGTEEEHIYGLLMPFNRDATKLTKLKTIYQTELSGGITGTGLEADIKSEMSSDELAYALFLLNAPPPETVPHTEASVVTPGTKAHDVKVPGGQITVETGVDIGRTSGAGTLTAGYTVDYQGGQSADSHWLQFIWSEVLATQADGSVKTVDEKGLGTSNGTMDLTTDPSTPKYKVDAASSTSPFYEAGFLDNRSATGTKIFDRPSEFASTIKRQFDTGATKVVERDHFDDFLIRDYKSIYHVSLFVEWEYTSKTASTKSTQFTSGRKVTAMDPAMREQLIKEFPKFDYIM